MEKNNVMLENLLKEVDGYFMQLVYLKDLIAVEKDISNRESDMEIAPNFTLIVECALIDGCIMALAKLYEESKFAEKTIPNLIEKCKKNKHLFSEPEKIEKILNNYENEMKENELIVCAIDTIRHKRDKILAHNDKKYFGINIVNEDSEGKELKMYHLWILCDFTEKVIMYISELFPAYEKRKTKYNNDLHQLLD